MRNSPVWPTHHHPPPPLVGVTDRTLISPGFLRHQSSRLGGRYRHAADTARSLVAVSPVSDRPPPLGELFVPRRAAKQDVFAPQSPVKAATGHAARKQADCAAATARAAAPAVTAAAAAAAAVTVTMATRFCQLVPAAAPNGWGATAH